MSGAVNQSTATDAPTIVRAARDTDWKQCPTCQGTGLAGEAQCSKCNGAGWECLRSGRWQRGQERDTRAKLWTRKAEENQEPEKPEAEGETQK